MAIRVPSPLVEFILLGPSDDRRQLQESPILGDVWIAFAKAPDKSVELLITPYKTQPAGDVAAAIETGIAETAATDTTRTELARRANIAYLQGIVVAQLTFAEVLGVVVPMTKWWADKWRTGGASKQKDRARRRRRDGAQANLRHDLDVYDLVTTKRAVREILTAARRWARELSGAPATEVDSRTSNVSPLDRYVVLAGLILWAGLGPDDPPAPTSFAQARRVLDAVSDDSLAKLITAQVTTLLKNLRRQRTASPPNALVWQISLNRVAKPALSRSVPAVKADAAQTLFKADCRDIAWAVIDSGIDGGHPAFRTRDGRDSRVKRSFDFTKFRQIVSLSNSIKAIRQDNVRLLSKRQGLLHRPNSAEAETALATLAEDLRHRRPIHWELVEKFVEMDPAAAPPFTNHGTHVAGILGANMQAPRAANPAGAPDDWADGMCPDIQLYDFRVLGTSVQDTEFAIIAALQFIRQLNECDNFFTIHGVNLSLSIPHDVRNFACGRTPICNECERLVESGVVVVAAAGNHGYKTFETQEGAYESYAAFSITDPGNAESIITVGATHRYWPHTYGISFFSSRGPTGDGRLKPDLVAPGERIRAPFPGGQAPGGEWGDLDGTSMAAPHVSGAAALLMARYSELIGQPRRIKRILCDTATDLGRERSFQGHGMLDVLRAFQSL